MQVGGDVARIEDLLDSQGGRFVPDDVTPAALPYLGAPPEVA